MTRTIIAAACLGLSLSAAGACDFNRSAQAEVDQTVVASVTASETKSMSTPVVVVDQAMPSEQAAEAVE